MRALVSPKDIVLIKPNIGWDCTPAQVARRTRDLVAAIVRACVDAGAKEIIVTDMSCNDAEPSFAHSGIADAARKAGARVILPGEAETRAVAIPGKPGVWTMLEPYVRATKVMQCSRRETPRDGQPHRRNEELVSASKGRPKAPPRRASRIYRWPRIAHGPTVTIVDATRVLLRNGPRGGNLGDVKKVDAIALGFDPVAIDALAANELGFDVANIDHLVLAEKRGLGTINYKLLSPVELHA